jgi:hypothetical protein
VDATELPSKRLPWTSIATQLNNERLPLDYNRRWPIIVQHAKLRKLQEQQDAEGTAVLDAALLAASKRPTQRIRTVPNKPAHIPKNEMSVNIRRLELLNKLIAEYVQ